MYVAYITKQQVEITFYTLTTMPYVYNMEVAAKTKIKSLFFEKQFFECFQESD